MSAAARSEVCLVLTGPTLDDCRRQLAASREWIDRAELRADKLDRSDWPRLNAFSREVDLPLVLTLRQGPDGGDWSGPDEVRRAFFDAALEGAWSAVDVEADHRLPEFEARWRARGGELVVSFHDFGGVPAGWADRVRSLLAEGVTAKAAVTPTSSADYHRFVADALALGPGRRVVIAMGAVGFSSRVLAARLGSAWTYAASPGPTVAPGLVTPQTLVELYRFREQTPDSPVYGIVGNPVFHTKSPHIHNPGLARAGLPGTYLPFLADDLVPFLATARLLGVRGLSCTLPFKERVLPLLESASAAVTAIGACNTLVATDTGWAGENTDAPGFLEPLQALRGPGAGRGATVIGTGGAARSVVWALVHAGYRVLVLGRDPHKAAALARDFGAESAELAPASLPLVREHGTVVAQTTNVGMGDLEGQDPLPWYHFQGTETLYEIIYAPARTALLERALAAGCPVLYGRQMLEAQAWRQFLCFTGHDYPREAE